MLANSSTELFHEHYMDITTEQDQNDQLIVDVVRNHQIAPLR